MQHNDSFQENSYAEKNLSETAMSSSVESVNDEKDLSETADTDTINSSTENIKIVTAMPSGSDSIYVTYEKIKSNPQEQKATIYRNPSTDDEISTDDEEMINDESPCTTILTEIESCNADVENTNTTT